MASKILFVVLFGCAVAFATPVNRATKTEVEALKGVGDIIQAIFEKLFEKIKDVIQGSLEIAFREISARLDTEEYREATAELQNIIKIISDNQETPNIGEEDKQLIEKELGKVGLAFERLILAALKNIKENNPEKVDATEFKAAVDKLKEVVDKIYPNQGTN